MTGTTSTASAPGKIGLNRFGQRLDAILGNELALSPKAAQTLLLIHAYGIIDRTGLRKAGILRRGEPLRLSIVPLIASGWLREAKTDASKGDWRQRTVWMIHPARLEDLSATIQSAWETYLKEQADCHNHLTELRCQPLKDEQRARQVRKSRLTHPVETGSGIPNTVSVLFNLRERYTPESENNERAPGLTVRAKTDTGKSSQVVKHAQIWNWTDHDFALAQARAITLAGESRQKDMMALPLEALEAEFSSRGVDFTPITIHQVLKQVAAVVDAQASSLPASVTMKLNADNTAVTVEPKGKRKNAKTRALSWRPLTLHKGDFSEDITLEDLITIATWYALYCEKEPCTRKWNLEHVSFSAVS